MLLNMDRGTSLYREILFWQGGFGIGFCFSFASSSYGLSRFFRNSKCFDVTHPILERDHKRPEQNIRNVQRILKN